MARSSVATDNFNRASLDANWTQINASSGGSVSISASTVYTGASSGNWAAAVWAGAGTFSNDQYAKATFVETDFGSSLYGIGVIVRASNDTDASRDYYFFQAHSNDTGTLGRIVNGTTTNLNTGAVTWNDGDTVELEVEGTTLRAMRNGVALGGAWTQTDSSLTTGKPGITAAGDSAVATGDNWEGGDIVAGGGRNRSLSLLGVG